MTTNVNKMTTKKLKIGYMNKTILIALFFGATNLFAQQQEDSISVKETQIRKDVLKQEQRIDTLTKKLKNLSYRLGKQKKSIEELQNENKDLQVTIDSLNQDIENKNKDLQVTIESLNQDIENKNKGLQVAIDSLKQGIQTNTENIVTNSKELGTKIQETGQKADTQITQLDSDVKKNRLYWIIATLATLLLAVCIYWLLYKRIAFSKTDMEIQLKNAKKSLEEESVKLDNKLVEILETQLKLKQEETKSQPIASNEKVEHSLALKVADEIIRIHKNLSRMDESTKGLKQLNSSVKRIQDNFASNGYELVDMLGKEYNEGMKVSANFVPSEDLETGKQIITRIIKPQVNFKGAMIQAAQIEVSVGE